MARHPVLGDMRLDLDGAETWLFCENETNVRRLYGQQAPGPFKDGIGEHVIGGDPASVSGADLGTKCAAHLHFTVAPCGKAVVRLRLRPADQAGPAFDTFDAVFAARRAEACAFYEVLQQDIAHPHERVVQRQALAGLLWSKQFYYFDVPEWLRQGSRQKHLPVLF